MTLIAAKGLSVKVGGRPILHNIDLEIRRGEIVTVVGPNGAGKTTLLRTLIGALPTSGGSVSRAPGLRVGYVPQRLHLDTTMPITVRRFLGLPSGRARAGAGDALGAAGIPDLGGRQMTELSGGEFQRALLARAVLAEPDLLLLDEPTQGLDQPGAAAFYQLIETLRRRLGCAVLLISHDLHVVMSAAERVICLNGHICCEGAPSVVSSAPEYRALFGHGTRGTLALYQHEHDHSHNHDADRAAG